MGYPILGKNADATCYIEEADFFVAIGESELREKLMKELASQGATFATLIHPSAVIGSRVEIGEGTVVMAGAILQAETVVGKGCILNTACSVDHGCKIGDYVHVSVGTHLCGIIHVGEHTWVGAGATLINGIHVCPNCMIGAGAVVVKNIKESRQAQMVPALLQKYKPDVIVLTGHDGMLKKGSSFHDVYNYRNSLYFIQTLPRWKSAFALRSSAIH